METPPLEHFLAVVVLLSVFTVLVVTMPPELYAQASEYRQQSTPEYFEAIEVQKFASTYQINITSMLFWLDWGQTEFGHAMSFEAKCFAENDNWLSNLHCHPWLFYYHHKSHRQEWINYKGISRGDELDDDKIDADMANGTASYTVKCEHFQMYCWVGYNDTKWDSTYQAWSNNELSLLFAIDFDEMGTGMNAWNIISMLLWFQCPDIHPVLNIIIAIPIWLCIAWLIFSFVMAVIRSLPFT